MPTLYVIGGPNGAGKTTAALELLPNFLNCKEYVNADAIAAGLSPFNVEGVAIQAGRLLLERINELADEGVDFAFESTLSAKTFVSFINKIRQKEYEIVLIYFWLSSPDLAIERVALRVSKGGHHIPEDVIRRRYKKSVENLINLYIPLTDSWSVFDNSTKEKVLVAEGSAFGDKTIYIDNTWAKIINQL